MDKAAPPNDGMTPDKIAQMIASGDKEQIKQAQRLLQGLGFYMGPIDGVLRNKKNESATLDAVKAYRGDFTETANRQLKGRELDANAEERSWPNQAMKAAPWLAIPAGMAYGYKKAKKIEGRQLAMEKAQRAGQLPDAPRSWSPTRRFASRFAPYAGQGALFAGEGLALRELVAPQIENATVRDMTKAAGAGMVGATIGMVGQGLTNSFTPQVSPDAPGPSLPPAPPANALAAAGAPAGSLPPPGSPSGQPPSTPPADGRPNRERLISAARAAGAKGKLNKDSAVAFLTSNITDANRPAVAAELGVKPGQRISSVIKKLSSGPGRSSWLLPIAAGAYAASEAGNEARAEGASPAEATGRSAVAGLAAGGTAAGGMYAMNKLAAAAPFLGPVMAPISIMTGPDFTPESEEFARNRTVRDLPFTRHIWQSHADSYDKAQVPERSPANSGPRMGRDPRSARPMNAMAAAGEQPDPFGQALDEFLRMVPEMQGP